MKHDNRRTQAVVLATLTFSWLAALQVKAQTAAPPAPPAPAAEALTAEKTAWSPIYTGSFFTRYELRSGYADAGVQRAPRFLEGDAMFYRARFGVGTGPIEVGQGLSVSLQATPQASGVWGALPNTISDAAFDLHEGYARVAGRYVRFDAGRFELDYGEALVLGNLDWHQTGRTFDGARARVSSSPESSWIDLFVTQLEESRPAGGGVFDGDLYFVGAYAGLGPSITKGLELDVYLLSRVWAETSTIALDPTGATMGSYERERAAEATLGVRAKQKLGSFDYRFEGGLQAGSRPGAAPTPTDTPPSTTQAAADVLAYHADLELGVQVVSKLRLSLEGMYASGDDPSTKKREGWDELYPTAHKFLGLSDAFFQAGQKRTNVASGVLHITAKPTDALALTADAHVFSRLEEVSGEKGYAASELDLGAAYALGKGLTLRGLYAAFLPSADFYAADDPVHYAELELRYTLKP